MWIRIRFGQLQKAKQEFSSEPNLKLAEEKARTKEQNKIREEEDAHAKIEKTRRVVERKKEKHQERERERDEI